MKKKQIALGLAALMMLTAAGGCSLIRFEAPQEALQQELERDAVAPKPDVFALLQPDKLALSDTLTKEDGKSLALYKARFPYFDAGGNMALENINEYYEAELANLEEDKARFFKIVEERPSQWLRGAVFDYELLDGPGDYITVLRSFASSDTLGVNQTTYYCEVFSAITGWKLKFSDVFGQDSTAALDALRGGLDAWSVQRGYATGWVYNAGDDDLRDNVTFDGETLYVGLAPFTSPGGETLAKLPVTDFEAYLK